MTIEAIAGRLSRLVADGGLDLPGPGAGRTHERLAALAAIAAADLALARLAEAHLDAITILAEAGRIPVSGARYGVWASERPGQMLAVTRAAGGGLTVAGSKGFCTGAEIVDRALVTARWDGAVVLLDVDARSGAIRYCDGSWVTQAFAETNTLTAEFDGLGVGEDAVVGADGWYLDRIGFWQGALAPAACWAGGAVGLIDHCIEAVGARTLSPHVLAHIGALDAVGWELHGLVRHAGESLDAAPSDRRAAERLARRFRSRVEAAGEATMHHALRAQGPRLLAHDEWAALRVAELQLFLRQHHAEDDLEPLGRITLGPS